jgi:hypothetical protein
VEGCAVVRRELLLVPESVEEDAEARVGVRPELVDARDWEVTGDEGGSDTVNDRRQYRRDEKRRGKEEANVESLNWTLLSCMNCQAAFSLMPFEAAARVGRVSERKRREGG